MQRVARVAEPANKDPFYEQFKYFFVLFRAGGRLPYMKRETGDYSYTILSLTTLYSVCVMLVYLYISYIVIAHVPVLTNIQSTYEKRIKNWMKIAYQLPQICSVFITFYETKKFVQYMNHWRQFNVQFLEIIGKPLPCYMKYLIPKTITVTLLAISIYGIMKLELFYRWNRFNLVVLFIFTTSTNLLIVLYWYYVCVYITQVAETLTDTIVKTLNVNPTARRISQFRRLWLLLCDLSLELPSSMSMAIITQLLSTLVYFIFSCYFCVYGIMEPNSSIDFTEFSFVLPMAVFIFIGYCNGAYIVKQKLGKEVLRAILLCKLLSLNEETRQEVELFLDTLQSNPPVMSFDGFFIADRTTLVQITSLTSVYMVVLFQFRVPDHPSPSNSSVNA